MVRLYLLCRGHLRFLRRVDLSSNQKRICSPSGTAGVKLMVWSLCDERSQRVSDNVLLLCMAGVEVILAIMAVQLCPFTLAKGNMSIHWI